MALTAGGQTLVREAAVKLYAVGETSGADLATGMFMTVARLPVDSALVVPEVLSGKTT